MYHLSAKIMKRHRSSVAAAVSYRVGLKLCGPYDQRMRYPHRNPEEIISHFTYNWRDPGKTEGLPADYQQIIDGIGRTERRCNSRLLREIVVALPQEGSDDERLDLILQFLAILAALFGVAFIPAIHKPPKAATGNHHAHIAFTTRRVVRDARGNPRLGEKVRSLDSPEILKKVRKLWEDCLNSYYSAKGLAKRVSCESNKERGIEKIPTIHEGPQSRASSGDRRVINRTIKHLNSSALINATSVDEAVEMIPAYLDGLEDEMADKNAKQQKLLEEIEKSLQELRLTERQRKQLKSLLENVRRVTARHDTPGTVADALRTIVLRGGSGGGAFDRLRRSLPPKGGDYEIVWAREGISLLSTLFISPQEETLAKIGQWSAGPHLWVPSSNPPMEDGTVEGILNYLREESEFMPPDGDDPPPPPV